MEQNTRTRKNKPGKPAAVPHDVILSNIYTFDVFDGNGEILPFSDKVWKKIDNETICFKDKISIATVQSYLSQNRNGICDDLREICNVYPKIEEESPQSTSKAMVRPKFLSCEQKKLRPSLEFSIYISKADSLKVKPVEIVYRDDRTYEKLQGPWTEIISTEIWREQKMKCAWSFKRNKISKSSKPYLTIEARCTDPNCGASLIGTCSEKPNFDDGFRIYIVTCDVKDVVHTKKQQCRGEARSEMKNKIVHDKPAAIIENEAASLMKSGDPIPAIIRNKSTYGKMLEEKKASETELENPNDIVKSIMTKVSMENSIRSFAMSKFHVSYWTNDQILLWKSAFSCDYTSISIDASGRFVKKVVYQGLENDHIFLYAIVIRVDGQITPLAQMISSRHDSLFIRKWLEKWLACGIPTPKQATTDNSPALQYGICQAFNNMTYQEYSMNNLEILLGSSKILPPCLLRMDIAHLIHACSGWKCFNNMLPIIKELYIKAIGFMSSLKNFNLFIQLLTAVFVLSENQFTNTKISKYKNWLITKLETYSLAEFDDQEEDEKPVVDSFNYEEEDENFLQEIPQDMTEFINSIHSEAMKNTAISGTKNCYECPGFSRNMKNLCKHFTAWTAVMVPFYESADEVATSTGSENYFRFLRQIRKFTEPQSIVFFYNEHLKSIVGRTNLTQAFFEGIFHAAQNGDCIIAPDDVSSTESADDSKLSKPVLNSKNKQKSNRGIHVQAQPNLSVIHSILEKNPVKKVMTKKDAVANASLSIRPTVVNGSKMFLRSTASFDSIFELFVHGYNLCVDFRDYVLKVRKTVQNYFLDLVYEYCTNKRKGFAVQRAKILYNIGDRQGDVINCTDNFESLSIKLLYNVCNLSVTQTCQTCQFTTIQNAFTMNNIDINEKIIYQDTCLSENDCCPKCQNTFIQFNAVQGFFILTFQAQELLLEKLEGHLKLDDQKYILAGAIGKLDSSSNFAVFCRHVRNNWTKHDSIDAKFKKHKLNVKVNVHFLLYIMMN